MNTSLAFNPDLQSDSITVTVHGTNDDDDDELEQEKFHCSEIFFKVTNLLKDPVSFNHDLMSNSYI